jgi:hypothetical protein
MLRTTARRLFALLPALFAGVSSRRLRARGRVHTGSQVTLPHGGCPSWLPRISRGFCRFRCDFSSFSRRFCTV